MEIKPDIVVAGFAKCGTTALHMFLAEHPDICMSNPKEINWFDKRRKPGIYSEYEDFFSHRDKEIIFGESSPLYALNSDSLEGLKKCNPDVKIILIMRNPYDRAYSHYLMHNDNIHRLWRRIKGEQDRLTDFKLEVFNNPEYIETGLYGKHVERVLSIFPRNNVFFIKNEDLLNFTQKTMDELFEFIGIGTYPITSRMINPVSGVAVTEDREQNTLLDKSFIGNVFDEDLSKLESITGLNINNWKYE